MSKMHLVCSAVICGLPLIFSYKPWENVRFIRHGSIFESLWWTFRALWMRQPFPRTLKNWDADPSQDNDTFLDQRVVKMRVWPFLRPFFRLHGYALHLQVPADRTIPDPAHKFTLPDHTGTKDVYPFARKFYKSDKDAGFGAPARQWSKSVCLWAAKDMQGNDVVIKVISDSRNPSTEWRALERFNDPRIRRDPRNHVIHVLEFLTFEHFVFAVMPRWDQALLSQFDTIDELMNMCYIWLEAFAFIHENRVAHCDILGQNAGVNVVHGDIMVMRGVNKPGQVRYAIYDFGLAFVYPMDTVLEDVQETRWLGWQMRGIPFPEGAPYNPFKTDVLFLGLVLQRRVRHLENFIPTLGPFFDRLVDLDEARRPMAQEAFDDFKALYAAVPLEIRNIAHKTEFWKNGKITYK